MQRSEKDLWVGLFVLVGGVAILFLALKAANLLTLRLNDSSYKVTAKFDNIGGLKPRAAVRKRRCGCGPRVAYRFRRQALQASVDLALQGRYVFPKDSSLKY